MFVLPRQLTAEVAQCKPISNIVDSMEIVGCSFIIDSVVRKREHAVGVLVSLVCLKAKSAKEDYGVILVTHESNVLSTHTDMCRFFSVRSEFKPHQLVTVAAAAQRSYKVLYLHTNWTVYLIGLGVKFDSDRPQFVRLCVFIINQFTPGNVDVWVQAIYSKSTFL